MTEQEIIAAAKTNWLAWQGLRELQPEVAAWMEAHSNDCRVLKHYNAEIIDSARVDFNCTGSVYRLRPDYEPERWWFCPGSKCVYVGAKPEGNPSVEVTPEYAEYLRNKPEGVECELREVTAGDKFVTTGDSGLWLTLKDGECVAGSWPYRWCKPKAPAYGWREYAVVERGGAYMVMGLLGAPISLVRCAGRVGFGGVQFEGQNDLQTWIFSFPCCMTPEGKVVVAFAVEPNDYKPAIPVKARFWEAQ